jgi:glutamyl-tRNA synthetase
MATHSIVRTRFAPSPTGFLHIGGARTALFSWLFARHHQGKFLLRIEDTDRKRHNEAALKAIFEGMRWLGLHHDEPVVHQFKRLSRYKTIIKQLLDEKKAYRCYCSKARLDALRDEQLKKKQKPKYDGYCLHNLPKDIRQPYVVRFNNPKKGQVKFKDMVRGPIVFNNDELDDLIIARADGSPTYNLTVVVDDWDMRITHVIRGDDHINNTPRQINLLKALSAPIPIYAHVPSILNQSGKKLSKRDNAANILDYRDQGFLPQALLNYLVRLGWSHKDQEIFSVKEMIQYFNGKAINNSPAKLNSDKLLWLNQHYLQKTDAGQLIPLFNAQLKKLSFNITHRPKNLHQLIDVQRERAKTLEEMAKLSRFFFEDFESYDVKGYKKYITPDAIFKLEAVIHALSHISAWQATSIHQVIQKVAKETESKLGQIAQPLRIAVSGSCISPPIDVTLALLGKTLTLKRIQALVHYARHHKGKRT